MWGALGEHMTFDAVEGLGLVAGLLGAGAMVPQALRIWRTRSAEDVSLAMYLMVLSAASMWVVYGWLKDSPSILFWNVVSAALALSVITLKLRTRGR
jgi:MtN3 and saliva related transmembrane protein